MSAPASESSSVTLSARAVTIGDPRRPCRAPSVQAVRITYSKLCNMCWGATNRDRVPLKDPRASVKEITRRV